MMEVRCLHGEQHRQRFWQKRVEGKLTVGPVDGRSTSPTLAQLTTPDGLDPAPRDLGTAPFH